MFNHILHILLLFLLAPPVAFAQEKGVFSIIRIEPADRENFYLKFGYDDALVMENQLNGDYGTTSIGGQTYYKPWLNIQQGQNASMKLNLGDYNASALLPSTTFVVKQDDKSDVGSIKINGVDSIFVSVDNLDNPFDVTCMKAMKGHVNVYCCDSVNSQRLLVGVLDVNCYEEKKPLTLRIVSTRRKGEVDYPQVDLQAIVERLNKYYVQAGVVFKADSLEYVDVAKGLDRPFRIGDIFSYGESVENNELFIVTKCSSDNINGESIRGSKVSFVFNGSNDVVYAHELGHAIVLYHVFLDEKNKDGRAYHIPEKSTNNIMDYTTNVHDPRKLFYKYQIEKIWRALNQKL